MDAAVTDHDDGQDYGLPEALRSQGRKQPYVGLSACRPRTNVPHHYELRPQATASFDEALVNRESEL